MIVMYNSRVYMSHGEHSLCESKLGITNLIQRPLT